MLLLHNQGNDLWARCAAREFKHVGTRTGPVCAMKTKNRVIWSEGLFLRPQHFQQSERFIEQWIDLRLRALARFAHGFTELELDREQLRMGKVALRNAVTSWTRPASLSIRPPVLIRTNWLRSDILRLL